MRKTATPRGKRAGRLEAPAKIRLGPLANAIGFNLRLAQDASFRVFARHAGETHLKPGRFAAMMVIHNNPGLTQMDLGRAIARDKSSVTPLIQELQRQGLVRRLRSKADRRRVTLHLTAAGERALQSLRDHADQHDRKLDAIVGDAKRQLIAMLRKIADELT
jgi:DNA-binding MarR family transcriptional regulator